MSVIPKISYDYLVRDFHTIFFFYTFFLTHLIMTLLDQTTLRSTIRESPTEGNTQIYLKNSSLKNNFCILEFMYS